MRHFTELRNPEVCEVSESFMTTFYFSIQKLNSSLYLAGQCLTFQQWSNKVVPRILKKDYHLV